MDIPSLKKELTFAYSMLPRIKGLETNKLTILTAAGVIIGTPVKDDTDSDVDVEMYKTANSTIADRYRSDNNIEKGALLAGNDGFIELKDVTLITGSITSKFKFLNVFYDQIIGVTFGSVEQQ